MEAFWRLNQFAVHDCAIVQHIADIDQTAVENRLKEVIHIMEMDHTVLMSLYNFLRKKHPLCQVLGHFPCNIISLGGCQRGILV